ncbi:GSE1_2 [Sanghuangporus sanghuang]
MRGFGTPLERVSEVDRTLAERFGACSRRLEVLLTLSESHATGSGMSALGSSARNVFQEQRSVDEAMAQIRRLSEEQEATIDDIRRIPGFEDFLRASPFEFLQQAASEGPVIVLNHSVFRCDAIIVLARENDPCVCIRLDRGFYFDVIELHEELTRIRKNPEVVSKIVQKLKELGINEGSRIWWCPTSVLSAFPFHAAGPYKGADGSMRYLLDDYISSYTPTLTSLVTARSGAQNGGERMLFVGDTSLPAAKKERDAIIRIRRFKQLLGDRATPESVLRLLQEAQRTHFTCHGLLKDEPFNSSLKLSGGRLTLLDIAHANLPHAEFAFLSACHTAEQGPNFALDEALHLAAGMQFCGFRSVVGTMWKLLDRDGPFLAGAVYGYMMRDLEGEETRFKRVTAAVREAALRLRERGDEGPDGRKVEIKSERWVNLVHIGA